MKMSPCLLAALAFLATLNVQAAPRYTITPTGASGAYYSGLYINQAGDIAGSSFVYSGGVLTDLGHLNGNYTEISGINDSKMLTGTMYSGFYHAEPFIYKNGAATTLGTMGAETAYGYAINNRGMVVGMVDTSPYDYPNLYAYGFLYANGAMQGLPTLGGRRSSANDINDAGVAVGTSALPDLGGGRAVRWENGAITSLGTLPGSSSSEANALNERADAVGDALVEINGGLYERSVIFSGGAVMDIGLLGYRLHNSIAYDINNWGEVVGTERGQPGDSKGYLYSDGRLLDLNALVEGPVKWSITGARGINDQHQIAAWGCRGDDCQALLLSPAAIPEPRTWLLLLGGLGVIWAIADKKMPAARAGKIQFL